MFSIRNFLTLRRYRKLTQRVEKHEAGFREEDDAQLREAYLELRKRRRKGAALDSLAPEVFALVRETSRRKINIRQYPMQVQAGFALAESNVLEMKTGEGKTFVAPLAAALYALDQNGVHVLTANDYLAGRDAEKLKPVYEQLGLKVSCVLADTPPRERAAAYNADITYTTVPQLGFDFLRQYFQEDPDSLRQRNMWKYMRSELDDSTREGRCLRGRYFAILDEVDSILIDYARRPLSISVQADIQHPAELYAVVRQFALTTLQEDKHYEIDKVERNVDLTDRGTEQIRTLSEEYGHWHLLEAEWEKRVEEALVAEYLYEKGTHYVIRQGTVCLIDQTSGRLMVGQRLGGELHQAVEAKEGVQICPRQEVAKKITVQSLIRPYDHLSGMTGTAWEAKRELSNVYSMKTVRFPPRRADQTEFRPDAAFAESDHRWEAVVEEVDAEHAKGRPLLVGTRSVEASEQLSEMLEEKGIEHDVLNAVNHEREAEIIAHAGEVGRVTVATNMAGRGVEITLGEGTADRGGIHVLGTERHLLGRMDRQLAGRTGRRGQPGSVHFFASLEDDIFEA
ncbi:MAG: preprotein translocase subunit SecA, partial [Planctomycetes bacterium]|nr:preprotein translocase subunit SecA [Planctomycetota bacterium]